MGASDLVLLLVSMLLVVDACFTAGDGDGEGEGEVSATGVAGAGAGGGAAAGVEPPP